MTLNTVTLDAELPQLVPVLADVEASGADGIIVQDLGLARLVRRLKISAEQAADASSADSSGQGD